jgi:acyl-CoA synthetase (AMP-forming)/AMP-acid ligase II
VLLITRDDSRGEKQIIAYIVPQAGATLTKQDIRRAVRERVPPYMIPSGIVFLEQIPLTPAGKVDRRALPPP